MARSDSRSTVIRFLMVLLLLHFTLLCLIDYVLISSSVASCDILPSLSEVPCLNSSDVYATATSQVRFAPLEFFIFAHLGPVWRKFAALQPATLSLRLGIFWVILLVSCCIPSVCFTRSIRTNSINGGRSRVIHFILIRSSCEMLIYTVNYLFWILRCCCNFLLQIFTAVLLNSIILWILGSCVTGRSVREWLTSYRSRVNAIAPWVVTFTPFKSFLLVHSMPVCR